MEKGQVEIAKIGDAKSECAVGCWWDSSGRYLLTGVLTPRIRVENEFRVSQLVENRFSSIMGLFFTGRNSMKPSFTRSHGALLQRASFTLSKPVLRPPPRHLWKTKSQQSSPNSPVRNLQP